MSWFKRKPKDVIPNPRDKRRRQDRMEKIQQDILHTVIFLDFALAFLILWEVA